MAIRTSALGGSDWALDNTVYSVDLNDTFNALVALIPILEKSIPPIGSIIPWHKDFGSDTLPVGWIACNGGTISDAASPINGQAIPNINGTTDATKLFIATGATSGATGGSYTHEHTLDSTNGGNTYTANSAPRNYTTGTGTIVPPCFEVYFIMRYK